MLNIRNNIHDNLLLFRTPKSASLCVMSEIQQKCSQQIQAVPIVIVNTYKWVSFYLTKFDCIQGSPGW